MMTVGLVDNFLLLAFLRGLMYERAEFAELAGIEADNKHRQLILNQVIWMSRILESISIQSLRERFNLQVIEKDAG